MTFKRDKKIAASPQFKQWLKHGLVEVFQDMGETHWRWTKAGELYAKYSTRCRLISLVAGEPLYPGTQDERAQIEPMIRKDWLKENFTEDGFLLIDETL